MPDGAVLEHVRVVLVAPKFVGNVGAAARLCANFECNDLWVVAPRCDTVGDGTAAVPPSVLVIHHFDHPCHISQLRTLTAAHLEYTSLLLAAAVAQHGGSQRLHTQSLRVFAGPSHARLTLTHHPERSRCG